MSAAPLCTRVELLSVVLLRGCAHFQIGSQREGPRIAQPGGRNQSEIKVTTGCTDATETKAGTLMKH